MPRIALDFKTSLTSCAGFFLTTLYHGLVSCLVTQSLPIVPPALFVLFTCRITCFYSTKFALLRIIHHFEVCRFHGADMQCQSKEDQLVVFCKCESFHRSIRFHCGAHWIDCKVVRNSKWCTQATTTTKRVRCSTYCTAIWSPRGSVYTLYFAVTSRNDGGYFNCF